MLNAPQIPVDVMTDTPLEDTQVNEFEPVGSYLLLTPHQSAEWSGGGEGKGLYIPEQARSRASQGTVIKMGPDVPKKLPGDPTGYAVGDVLLFTAHSELKVMLDGKEYYAVEWPNVILRQRRKVA